MTAFTMTRKVEIHLDKVWSIAGDFTKSPGQGIAVDVESGGDPGLHGAGAIRNITVGKVCVRERLESLNPANKSFTYRILSGTPMKEHFAKAEFIPHGSSTEIRWSVQFKPKVPGTGWIVASLTRKAINQYLDVVEKAAR